MEIELDLKKLKKDFIGILEKYIQDPKDKANLEKAKEIYNKYLTGNLLLPENMSRAHRALLDIGYNTGIKIEKKKAEKILKEIQE